MVRLKLRKDNRGVTLVELMLSMALLVIVTGCVIMLMSSASKGYARGDIQIKLQKEGQDAINYMTDATLSSNYAVVVSSAAVDAGVLLYGTDENDPANTIRHLFVQVDKAIYYYYGNDAATNNLIDQVIGGSEAVTEKYKLCSNVSGFLVRRGTDAEFKSNPNVGYAIHLKAGVTEFKVQNTVNLRNMIVKP